MLRIERTIERDRIVLSLCGRIEAEHIPELERAIAAERQPVILDLSQVMLVDRDAVAFLVSAETAGIGLEHCASYLRHWITRARSQR